MDGIFTIVESETEYEFSLSTGGSSVASPRVTGRIPATITFDTDTLRASVVQLRDTGVIEWEDFSFSVDGNIRYDGLGTLLTTISTEFRNVGTEILRVANNVRINPITGELNTSDFRLETNRGQGSFTVSIGGISETQTAYFSQNPEETILSKSPELKIERIKDDLYGFQYDFSFGLEFEESATERMPDTNLSITTSERVRLLAKFSHAEEPPFGYWYRFYQYHFDGASLDSESPTGVPMYLAFALGHQHYRNDHQRPFTFYTFDGATYFSVISPGRYDTIGIERSPDPGADNWSPIPVDWLVSGRESLNQGSLGNISVKLPETDSPLFLRVVAAPPRSD